MINQDIEASVIGGLLISGLTPMANEVLSTLAPEAFGIKFYQDTYRVIQAQARTRSLIDPMMVAEAMGDGHFADVMETYKKCPSAANLKGYAGIVSDNFERRQVLALIDELKDPIASRNHSDDDGRYGCVC